MMDLFVLFWSNGCFFVELVLIWLCMCCQKWKDRFRVDWIICLSYSCGVVLFCPLGKIGCWCPLCCVVNLLVPLVMCNILCAIVTNVLGLLTFDLASVFVLGMR